MIREILDADKKAQKAVESSEYLKLESAHKINELLEKRRSEYIDKARMNINVIKKIEDSKAKLKIDLISKECQQSINRINNIYLDMKDEWVDNIVKNVTEFVE